MIVTCLVKAGSLPVHPDRGGTDSLRFYDGQQFAVIGKFHSEKNYVRLPQKYKATVRNEVWDLSQQSAGLGIRFRTNAAKIVVRWTVTNDAVLPHMAATGVKGVDLYTYDKLGWQYVNTGFPRKKSNEFALLVGGDSTEREYLLNLPLYDGVDSLSIGVNTGAWITLPKEQYLLAKKPVVYYGTSIAQGACATRPGMAYTNILARKLDRMFINLGFSGDGKLEMSVGQAMVDIDAALYVIDCNPNTPAEQIYERAFALVNFLRQARPDVPIMLVDGFTYEQSYFIKSVQTKDVAKRNELKRAYDALTKVGTKALFYQKGEGMIGDDHEGTVDGVHPNDVGMDRFANALLPIIRSILND